MATLTRDTLLGIHLSAICGRDRYTQHPEPVIAELIARAGGRLDVLVPEVGSWIGYYQSEHTATLCAALLDQFPDAAQWVHVGQERRSAPTHGTTGYGAPRP